MLEVRLLGKFELQHDGKPVIISSRIAQSLFAYLIINAGTAHRREKLAGMFWPLAVLVCTIPDGGLNFAQIGFNKPPEAIGSTVTPVAGVALDVPTQTAVLNRMARISAIANNLLLNILESPFGSKSGYDR